MAISLLDAAELRDLTVHAARNALLAGVDASMFVASPAVALLKVGAEASRQLPAGAVFRSAGSGRETVLSVIGDGFWAHPYQAVEVSWIFDLPDTEVIEKGTPAEAREESRNEPPARSLARGIRIRLVRQQDSVCRAAPLTLLIETAAIVHGALQRCQSVVGGARGACRRVPLPLAPGTLVPEVPGVLFDRMAAACRDLIELELPRQAVNRPELCVELFFDRPMPVTDPGEPPRVDANVVPVWNAVRRRYPQSEEAAQVLAELHHRRVHPLQTVVAGPGWVPFAVTRVGAAEDRAKTLRFGVRGDDGYLLVSVPPDLHEGERSWSGPERGRAASLAVVLAPAARALLDKTGSRLIVDFLATTGKRGNGIPAGTKFRRVDDTWNPDACEAELRTSTCGGDDGISDETLREMIETGAGPFLRRSSSRTIGEIAGAIKMHLGDELELVDPRDLLRFHTADGARGIVARVRVLDESLAAGPREGLVEAAGLFLERFAGPGEVPRIRLVVDKDES